MSVVVARDNECPCYLHVWMQMFTHTLVSSVAVWEVCSHESKLNQHSNGFSSRTYSPTVSRLLRKASRGMCRTSQRMGLLATRWYRVHLKRAGAQVGCLVSVRNG